MGNEGLLVMIDANPYSGAGRDNLMGESRGGECRPAFTCPSNSSSSDRCAATAGRAETGAWSTRMFTCCRITNMDVVLPKSGDASMSPITPSSGLSLHPDMELDIMRLDSWCMPTTKRS